MLKILEKIFSPSGKSNLRAKSRLHFVLVQDRTGLNSEQMSAFKEELVAVIDKYFVIDKSGFDVAYKRENDQSALVINSPVVVRRQEAVGGKVGSKSKVIEAEETPAI